MSKIIPVILILAYIVSPFDLIPEAVYGIVGLIDDVFAFGGLLLFIAKTYYTFIGEMERGRFRQR
jgi:RING finger protein 170